MSVLRKLLGNLMMVLVIGLFLTACQGAEEDKANLLSEEESEWLVAHPVIRLAPDPDFPPTEYFDENGEYRGIAADYVELVGQKLGIQFEIVHLQNWDEVLEKAKSRQIDMFGAATKTPQRAEYMLFTKPYLEFPAVIIVESNVKATLTLEKLSGMKVAVVSGYAAHDFITHYYPELYLDVVPDVQTGLRKVSFGMVDAFVANLATTTYYIEKEGIANLRIAGESGYVYRLAFASRKDWPELNQILEKGLAQISEKERQTIFKKWIQLEPEPLFAKKEFWITIFVSLGAVALVIGGIMMWNRSLKRQVDQKTEELRKYQEHLEELVKERTNDLEEKTAELEQANIRLQEMDRLKSVFLASMSHELRTPLNSIIGFTGIILQGMSGEVNEEQKKQLTMVKNSASHLLSLINDVLDISKIEAGRVELTLEELSLDDVVREVVETLAHTASEKGLELLTEVPEGITLSSDKRRVKQVLMNLVSNAVKFTDQGSVQIAARISEGQNLEVRVIDTGIGMKKEDMEKLFQPFQQIDVSLTKKHEGTGLGLHLTERLAALLGGDISVKSEYGTGSEFTFTLPLRYKEGKRSEEDTGG